MAETPYPHLPPDIAAIIARMVEGQSGGTVSAVTLKTLAGGITVDEERIVIADAPLEAPPA